MTGVAAFLRYERRLVVVALVGVTLLAWGYLLLGAGMGMSHMEMPGIGAPEMNMPGMERAGPAWTADYAVLVFVMWWIMMVAMMLPSATPAILLYARVGQAQPARGAHFAPASLFAFGYLAIWGGFSLLAAAAHWALATNGLVSGMMESMNTRLDAGLLLAAGIWQLTPVKHACLRHCRGPMEFFQKGFRAGRGGAVVMGAEHGLYCLGCCWFLMLLLFYGGVMNLAWVGALALYVLVEKAAPGGHRIGAAAGIACLAWGSWLLIAS